MQVKISTRHGHLSDASQQNITAKAEKLLRIFDRITAIELTIDLKDSNSPRVDAKLSAEHKHDFVAHDQSDNLMGFGRHGAPSAGTTAPQVQGKGPRTPPPARRPPRRSSTKSPRPAPISRSDQKLAAGLCPAMTSKRVPRRKHSTHVADATNNKSTHLTRHERR